MNNHQRFIFNLLKDNVPLIIKHLSLAQVLEPIVRYAISLLSIYQGISEIDEEKLEELSKQFCIQPNANLAMLLNLIALLDIIEQQTTLENKQHERTIPNLQNNSSTTSTTDSL